jgi:hypothetical protein
VETLARVGTARTWLGLFITAQLVDVLTTVESLRLGGVESNPLVLSLISGGGMGEYATVKLLSVAVGVTLIYLADSLRTLLPQRLSSRVSRSLVIGLQLGVAVQLLAIAANLIALGGELRA